MKNPLSLDALIDWLRKQPADGIYDYGNCNGCLLTQYFNFLGFKDVTVSPTYWTDWTSFNQQPLPKGFDEIACPDPSTFGAALNRALLYQELHP